jgi:hypothetical protein
MLIATFSAIVKTVASVVMNPEKPHMDLVLLAWKFPLAVESWYVNCHEGKYKDIPIGLSFRGLAQVDLIST